MSTAECTVPARRSREVGWVPFRDKISNPALMHVVSPLCSGRGLRRGNCESSACNRIAQGEGPGLRLRLRTGSSMALPTVSIP